MAVCICSYSQLTFHGKASLKWIVIWSPMRRQEDSSAWNEEPLPDSYTETVALWVRHTFYLKWVDIYVCSYCAAWEQQDRKVMTPPLSVEATGAIDRWPRRLFTVKAPSIALLHYVTFSRALVHWNSAPRCPFKTIPHSIYNMFNIPN